MARLTSAGLAVREWSAAVRFSRSQLSVTRFHAFKKAPVRFLHPVAHRRQPGSTGSHQGQAAISRQPSGSHLNI